MQLTYEQETILQQEIEEAYLEFKKPYKRKLFDDYGIDCSYDYFCYIRDCLNSVE